MRIKEYNTRDVIAILAANGYELLRTTKSSHNIYSDGVHTVSIPIQNKTVNKMLFARIVKENGLKICDNHHMK